MPPTLPPIIPINAPNGPGQLEIIRNSSNSWTIRKIEKDARFPILSGPGGTEYGFKPPPVAIDNVTRFHQGIRGVWGGFSVYGDNPGFNFGYRQPYVWINLTDSSFKKYIKKFDNQGFPIGATIQDVQRMSKMMISGKGVFFSLTQFSLQQQNAFNETRVWNPLSIVTAAARQGSLGLLSYPTRHIEGGGGFLGNIKAGFLSSVGLQSEKDKAKVSGIATSSKIAPGTQGSAISLESASGIGIPTKGFVRGETGHRAVGHFTSKWAPEGEVGKSGGFLSKLGSALIEKLKSLIPSTTGRQSADWKIRMEYGKVDVFKTFLEDKGKLLNYTAKNIKNKTGVIYTANDIHIHTGEDGNIYSEFPGVPRVLDFRDLLFLQSSLSDGNFRPNEPFGKPIANKRDIRDLSTENAKIVDSKDLGTLGIVGATDIIRWDKAMITWKERNPRLISPSQIGAGTFYHAGIKTYKQISEIAKDDSKQYLNVKSLADSRLNRYHISQASKQNASDLYNTLGVLDKSELTPIVINPNKQSSDSIIFYFHDLINDKYIPFRATLTSINENTSVKWEDVQYMGRADSLCTYNGFTRDLNFAFSVYANSIRELIPMWKRINYLSGLTRPAKYTDGDGVMSGFIYPPLIKIRIGDLYVDQPGVISSFGLTVPDDSPWEMARIGEEASGAAAAGIYKYLEGTHQEIAVGNIQSRQLPLKVDISISMRLLEKELSRTGNQLYFNIKSLN